MKSELFWDITQRMMAVPYRRFGTTCRSHLQGSRNARRTEQVPHALHFFSKFSAAATGTVQYSTAQYSTVQYSTVQYSTYVRLWEFTHICTSQFLNALNFGAYQICIIRYNANESIAHSFYLCIWYDFQHRHWLLTFMESTDVCNKGTWYFLWSWPYIVYLF